MPSVLIFLMLIYIADLQPLTLMNDKNKLIDTNNTNSVMTDQMMMTMMLLATLDKTHSMRYHPQSLPPSPTPIPSLV